jgi:hypothetical protein
LGRDKIVKDAGNWQEEAWGFYGRLGEYREGVDWLARALSRVRLVPAVQKANADEPEVVESGPAFDLLAELASGTDGQAQMLGTLSTLLTVPGESWLTGEGTDNGVEWVVRSSSEIREGRTKNARREPIPEVIDDASATSNRLRWRPLDPLSGDEWFVAKLWSRDKQYRHLPSSPSKAALADLRRLELVNRRINAELRSRLIMNGFLLLPNEVTFPTRPEFADEVDPFVAELIAVAREALAGEGSVAETLPLPLKVPGEWLEKIKHLTFANPIEERLLEVRTALLTSVATSLSLPAEKLTGVGDLNHWSLSQLDEDGLKEYIAPHAELLVHCVNRGFVWPMLGGPSDDVFWYDLSELSKRPDRSEAARDAYDRLELSPTAYRRETGFDEADKPTDDERKDMALLALLKTTAVRDAATELGILEPAPEPVAAPGTPGQPDGRDRPADGPPDTRDNPPPSASPNGKAPARQPA